MSCRLTLAPAWSKSPTTVWLPLLHDAARCRAVSPKFVLGVHWGAQLQQQPHASQRVGLGRTMQGGVASLVSGCKCQRLISPNGNSNGNSPMIALMHCCSSMLAAIWTAVFPLSSTAAATTAWSRGLGRPSWEASPCASNAGSSLNSRETAPSSLSAIASSKAWAAIAS